MGLNRITRRPTLVRKRGKWWIKDVPPYHVDGAGPFTEYGEYDSKAEAEADRKGIERTLKQMASGKYEDSCEELDEFLEGIMQRGEDEERQAATEEGFW